MDVGAGVKGVQMGQGPVGLLLLDKNGGAFCRNTLATRSIVSIQMSAKCRKKTKTREWKEKRQNTIARGIRRVHSRTVDRLNKKPFYEKIFYRGPKERQRETRPRRWAVGAREAKRKRLGEIVTRLARASEVLRGKKKNRS